MEEQEKVITEEQSKKNREEFKQRLINEGKIPSPTEQHKKKVENIYGSRYKAPWEN
jgi:hypothetical protein